MASRTGNDRLQNFLPVIRAMNIAVAKDDSFHVALLIEAEQWMIAGALKVAVVGGAFLIAIGRTHRTIHIKDDLLE